MTQYIWQKIGTFFLVIGLIWGSIAWIGNGALLFTEYGPITKINSEKQYMKKGCGACDSELKKMATINFEYKKSDGTIGYVQDEFECDSRSYKLLKEKKIYGDYHGGKIFFLLFCLIGGGLATFFSFIDGWHTDDVIDEDYGKLREDVVMVRLKTIWCILIFLGNDSKQVDEAFNRYTNNESNLYKTKRYGYSQVAKINRWREYWTDISEELKIVKAIELSKVNEQTQEENVDKT